MRRRSGSPSVEPRPPAAAALIALSIVLAGCPANTPRPSPSGDARPTPRARTGGTIVVAYPQEPATLDPFAPAGDMPATRDLVRLVMPALWRLGPSDEPERWLLAEEPVVAAGPPFSVRITLRSDAAWSDGQPITARDVRFTWRSIARARPRSPSRDGYDRISDVVVEDAQHARIEFSERFARWRDLFSSGLGVLPAHALGTKARRAELARRWRVSGGPFVLSRWRRGLDMTFRQNLRALPETVPLVDTLRVVFVPDAAGALELLRRGEVDALGPYLAPDLTRHAREIPGTTVTADTGSTWAGLLLNTEGAPLHETAVRRALADSIDRERIARGLVASEGTALDTAAPGSIDTSFGRYGSVKRARERLSDAGWRGSPIRRKGGRPLTLNLAVAVPDDLGGVVARAIQFQALEAGFDVQPIALEPDTLWSEWLNGPRFRAALLVWRDPPGGAVRGRFGLAPNPARLEDARLRSALRAADRTLDAPDQTTALRRLAALVPVIPLFRATVTVTTGPTMRGARASASADGPFWNAHDWARA